MISNLTSQEFVCSHCGKKVTYQRAIGTHYRNHCPDCLWSQHEDLAVSGDRKSTCHGQMEPIGLTFKKEGKDRYGRERQGELMIIHQCLKCGKISINRLAGDDNEEAILQVLENSKNLTGEQKHLLETQNIKILQEQDKEEILVQLYGK